MAVNSKKIEVNSLIRGMYISKLDRPWIDTSYPIEGFYLQTAEDIKQISSLCQFVYIDVNLTKLHVDIRQIETSTSPSLSTVNMQSVVDKPRTPGIKKRPLRTVNNLYLKRVPFEKEFKTANKLYTTITQTATEVLSQVEAGKYFNIDKVNQTASAMVDSIIRNPDALLWLSRLKEKDTHTHNRSIRATIWAIAFGRYLSLPKKELTELSIAVLLSNIGKARLPRELLKKSDTLEGAEQSVYQKHVSISVKLLTMMKFFSDQTIKIVAQHCERYDGSGYPRKLTHDKIVFPAQIAGLVSYYEKITNQRNNSDSLDATRAMGHLYLLRNEQFEEGLIEEFIQSIGIYPAGSLIELNSKEVAVIIEQNDQHRLLPKVMILRDNNKKPVSKLTILDLSTFETQSSNSPKIINSLPISSYDIDSTEIINSLQKADNNRMMKNLFS